MNQQDALKALGLNSSVSRKEVIAAFHKRAKETHPDCNAEMAGNTLPFERCHKAYQFLLRGADPQPGNGSHDKKRITLECVREADVESAAMQIVRAFLTRHAIEILFDGTMRKASDKRTAVNAEDIDECLAQDEIDADWVMDTLTEELDIRGEELPKTDAKRALRMIVREARVRRRKTVLRPLFSQLSNTELKTADEAWARLSECAFESDALLVVACLKHFIWQVKQKSLNRPVKRHLMPVIYSPIQGSGKTTFVIQFLGPLRELAPDPVLLSDLADVRTGEIFRFPVLVVDDMEKIRPDQVPILKQLLTADGLRRRKMGTSLSGTFRQRATLIGTANSTVDELVADDTGHRRFVTLHFRNGEVAKGGSEAVWKTVDETNYELLWRSVDAFGPSPIEPVLDTLAAVQELNSPLKILKEWLYGLDAGAEEVLNITQTYRGKGDGIKPAELHKLFIEQTDCQVTSTWFGIKLRSLVVNDSSPIGRQDRTGKERFWPLKCHGWSDA